MSLDFAVPDYTSLSRHQADLKVDLPVQPHNVPMPLVIDATGLKVFGEGEWNVRQYGWSKRRTWRKLPLGVQEATGEIGAQTLTPARVDDASQVVSLLNQIQTPVQTVSADGT